MEAGAKEKARQEGQDHTMVWRELGQSFPRASKDGGKARERVIADMQASIIADFRKLGWASTVAHAPALMHSAILKGAVVGVLMFFRGPRDMNILPWTRPDDRGVDRWGVWLDVKTPGKEVLQPMRVGSRKKGGEKPPLEVVSRHAC